MRPRVYLAGPDVFRRDAEARYAAMQAVCAQHGLVGVSPLDALEGEPTEWAGLNEAFRIHRRNEAHMRRCAAIIANLTPFRGPSADVGTAYELGFMRALGRPVFGWAAVSEGLTERTLALLGGAAVKGEDGGWRDGEGMAVEAFGLVDNLMLDGAIAAAGSRLFSGGDATALFERCVEAAAAALRT